MTALVFKFTCNVYGKNIHFTEKGKIMK